MAETERFDIYDERGNWLGTATREDVHRRGHWHHTVHCWLVRPASGGAGARVLFQQRAEGKDTNPGSFDITAAGHLAAGETPAAVVRELEEELGIRAAFEELREFGVIREEASGTTNGAPYIDAEVSHVFGLATDLPLEQFRLQEEEVAGLYEADAGEMVRLMEDACDEVAAAGVAIRDGRPEPAAIRVTREAFVSRDYGYYAAVFKFLQQLAAERE